MIVCMLLFLPQVATNGIISFGSQFPHFSATLFPNPNNPTVFNSYVAAPYWSDIDNRNFGEIWYETHRAGQSSTSDTLLGRVSNLVRSEQGVPSFQGTWMIVAMWNGSVPFAGTGLVVIQLYMRYDAFTITYEYTPLFCVVFKVLVYALAK